jgi:capsular exopolysaccharide synthesis family protein
MSPSPTDFNLRYGLRVSRRRLPIFVLCVLLVPAATILVSVLQKKEYSARAVLLFRDPQLDQKLFGSSFVQSETDPTRQAATNLDLVSLQRVAALTASHLPGVTQAQVSSAVNVSGMGQADLVSIDATERSARFAARLANIFATTYIAFRRDADRATIQSAEVPLRRQLAALPVGARFGPLWQSLQTRLSQLKVLSSLQTGNAELVQPAQVPSSPSSPKLVRNGALGIFFGIVLGIALVLVAEALDRRLRDPAEVEQTFERPLLAAVPENSALTKSDLALLSVPDAGREAFRMLWANLRYFSLSRDIRSVLITSADRDDGKSTVAWGLAVAAASAGSRTLLIEADLRNPSFAKRFELPSHDGLTNVLAGEVTLAQAAMRLPLPLTEEDVTPTRAMDVLLAGPRPPDPTDLLQSPRMSNFLREAEDQYDLVLIDTPPAAVVSDAIPLITMARGVIVVSRLGKSVREHAHRLRRQLDHLEAPVLGVVVNFVGRSDLYTYGYGYEYKTPTSTSAPVTNGAPPWYVGHPDFEQSRRGADTTASARDPGPATQERSDIGS